MRVYSSCHQCQSHPNQRFQIPLGGSLGCCPLVRHCTAKHAVFIYGSTRSCCPEGPYGTHPNLGTRAQKTIAGSAELKFHSKYISALKSLTCSHIQDCGSCASTWTLWERATRHSFLMLQSHSDVVRIRRLSGDVRDRWETFSLPPCTRYTEARPEVMPLSSFVSGMKFGVCVMYEVRRGEASSRKPQYGRI